MPNQAHTQEPALAARIVAATSAIIASGGREAATTRAIATSARVQAPTIYRIFGNKRGLMNAVAQHGLADYVAQKSARVPHPDPVQDLRDGWDTHVAFGLAHPGLFTIMASDPNPRPLSPAAAAGVEVLQKRVQRIALAGRLCVSEDRAVTLLQATCIGTVLTLLGQPPERRDSGLSETAREAVISAITGVLVSEKDRVISAAASTLKASLAQSSALTDGEKHLMGEWLERMLNRLERAVPS